MRFKSILVIAAVLSVSGCATPSVITGKVSTATFEQPASGATFTVHKPEVVSLREAQVVEVLSSQMRAAGFVDAENPAEADVIAVYSANMGQGQIRVGSSPDYVYGGKDVHSYTEYPRFIQVFILDREQTELQGKPVILWQGEAYSEGSSGDLAGITERLIPKIFDFYGDDVTNNRIFIPAMM